MIKLITISCSLLAAAILLNAQQNEFTNLTGPYLGQKPPGMTPEIFAPGIVSTQEANIHSSVSFTPGGRQLFFARLYSKPYRVVTFCLSEVDGQWQFVPPDSSMNNCFSPLFLPDGNSLLLAKQNSLVISHRLGGGWTPVEKLGPEINFQKRQDGASMALDGTIYFTTMFGPQRTQDGIYYSKLDHDKYMKATRFNTGYAGKLSDGYPFIAPDQSYLIFMSWRPGGYGKWDLYITFKNDAGTWTTPVNMGATINTDASESFPCVSPDGRYFFFNSNRKSSLTPISPEHFYGNIYWVSAKIIEELKPKQ
ncbi:MAG: PD40 domain-containing protein [Syntrophaceae bacterium]|nr:PD40 domain-containing protein [Syntrophaceae bacterium]